MLVLEPTYTIAGDEGFDVDGMISALRTAADGSTRLLIAYVDIGQAEDYRTYWGEGWVAPTETEPGDPDFLVTIDPDGWSGNYPVAYWDSRWQELWIGEDGIIAQLATHGFDGIYLDWIEAYDDEKVIERAEVAGKDAPDEMVSFISRLKEAGQSITPDFLVIAQNAPYLLDDATDDYASKIDALAVEDTWFGGDGDAGWDDPDAGDIANSYADDYSTDALLTQYDRYLALDKPVFTVDYCISESNASWVYAESRAHGFVPLVTRVPLSELTETPPP
jgi:cysteinyl-tRNA synthetase